MSNDSPDRPSKSAREAPRLQRQDQRHEPQLAEQEPQLIDMSELASRITTAPSRPDDYAPPARRMEKLGELASRVTTAPSLDDHAPPARRMEKLGELASRITTAPSPDDHAPEARRMEKLGEIAVRTIESFSALPTTELDEMIRAVKAEIAQLETEAEEIRNTYVTHTDRLAAAITRLAAGCGLAKETLAKLREQCAALPETPAPARKRSDQGGRAVDKGT